MISGGAMRMEVGLIAFTIRPASSAAAATAGAASCTVPMPISSPRPRTSVTTGEPRPSTAARISRPRRSALPIRSACSISSSTAFATAVANGLPPNVLPWSPRCSRSLAAPKVTIALSGTPPAMPFAIVTASGTTPSCWKSNQRPVRPTPVWISSTISSAPCRSVSSRAARR